MRRRAGFTITELLVAMALIVFVMSILATAFSEGTKTFRKLKALGDMNQRMRTVTSLLRDDLQADHFGGKRRLSDTNFWSMGPPNQGFFRVWQGSPLSLTNVAAPYYQEGNDTDFGGTGIPSLRATDHLLHFTSRKRGNDPKDFYRAAVPSGSPLINFGNVNSRYQDPPPAAGADGTFTSQWAEIAWFLRSTGQSANGTPLFTLYRRQRVVVANPETGGTPNLNWGTPPVSSTAYNPPTAGVNYLDISCRVKGSQVYFNSLSDLTVPQFRFAMKPKVDGGQPAATDPVSGPSYFIFQPHGTAGANTTEEWTGTPPSGLQGNLKGADAVMTDVISFAVRVRTTGDFIDLPNLGPSSNTLSGPATGYFFDTWTDVNQGNDPNDGTVNYSLWNNPALAQPHRLAPYQQSITALQIELRVWDPKTEQSRQVTVIVDM